MWLMETCIKVIKEQKYTEKGIFVIVTFACFPAMFSQISRAGNSFLATLNIFLQVFFFIKLVQCFIVL